MTKKKGIFIYNPIVYGRLAYFDSEGRPIKDFGYPYTGEEGKEETICGIALDHRNGDLYVLYTPFNVIPDEPSSLRIKKYTYPPYKLVKDFDLKEETTFTGVYDRLSIDAKGDLYIVNEKNVICKFNPNGKLLKKISLKAPPYHPYDLPEEEIKEMYVYKREKHLLQDAFMGAPIQWLRIDY